MSFAALTAVTIKVTVFLDVTSCSLEDCGVSIFVGEGSSPLSEDAVLECPTYYGNSGTFIETGVVQQQGKFVLIGYSHCLRQTLPCLL